MPSMPLALSLFSVLLLKLPFHDVNLRSSLLSYSLSCITLSSASILFCLSKLKLLLLHFSLHSVPQIPFDLSSFPAASSYKLILVTPIAPLHMHVYQLMVTK